MATNDFDSGSEDNFDIICNVVSVLPREYDYITKVEEPLDYKEEEMVKHKTVCYFVMNNGYIVEKNTFFERPDKGMKSHLKPLFIRAKVENTTINKILNDGGVVVNLMPHFFKENRKI